MNKEWSELNKTMQAQIKKKDAYKTGIDTLISLRSQLMQTLVSFKEELCREDFNAIPFINADGYHSKTIAYSIWHIFRIEDIVVHTVIKEDDQVFLQAIIKSVSIHLSLQREMNSLSSRLQTFQNSLIWKNYIPIFLKYVKTLRKCWNGYLMTNRKEKFQKKEKDI